ncbi:hypothetical protein MTsPCn5_31090 [Croceitalea sp. MTPC5]|uniref:DUF6973 domain-containing protein n=1 Tax=Croceitalea sp. MTPC5 TaxID=3056565 RepID=UPI002B3962EA|nr:hypothetical protein MTsPCn5_31090 [Croceitalea sp. MTPC5]
MNILRTLKRIDFPTFWSLLRLCLRYPLLPYPTIVATKACLKVSTQYFGKAHYQNTAANAFRHAYWNYLIAKLCTKWSKNEKRVLLWTKAITDWHENAFKNRELAKLMDLHNNRIGRTVFKENSKQPVEKITTLLLEMTKDSVLISSKEALAQNPNNLVHLV